MTFFDNLVRLAQEHRIIAVIIIGILYLIVREQAHRYNRRKQDEEESERIAENNARARREQLEREALALENSRREFLRRQWIATHKPALFYNTIDGVTAVLTFNALTAARHMTQIAFENGTWAVSSRLIPIYGTVIFTTDAGRERVVASLGSELRAKYHTAGFTSTLREIAREWNVELIRAEDIFVPGVSEALMPFNKQWEAIGTCHDKGNSVALIQSQAPLELQPTTYLPAHLRWTVK